MKTIPQTPGPWVVDLNGVDSIENMVEMLGVNVGEEDEWIAVGCEDEDGYAESVAYCHPSNAPVIAAAPTMLSALRAVVARIHGVYDDPDLVAFGDLRANHDEDVLLIAETAIEAAKGKG